jgi:hypothetical protein
VRRALALALLLLFAGAAPASANPPFTPGAQIGGTTPLRADASITPPVAMFGDVVTARLSVVADTKWVNPSRLRVSVEFAPYVQVGRPQRRRLQNGRVLQETWTWSLRCLTTPCVPVVPPSDHYHNFRFAPAHVQYLGPNGKVQYGVFAPFPQLEAVSAVSPAELAYVFANNRVRWAYQLAPAVAAPYRVSPELLFWLAIALAGVLGAAGVAVVARWALRLRAPASSAAPLVPASHLERALALFFWANAHGDETLQRKALERVADELPLDVVDLSEVARELAWSPETPEGEEVEAISERAGVPHHENGAAG